MGYVLVSMYQQQHKRVAAMREHGRDSISKNSFREDW